MSFKDVIHCSTKICGHAFVLAIMLTYGSAFKIDDLPAVDQTIRTIRPKALHYPIRIVNRKTFKGRSQYIGRTMSQLAGSPLGNPYKIQPHGPHTREESVHHLYRKWIWKRNARPNESRLPRTNSLGRISRKRRTRSLLLVCTRALPWDDHKERDRIPH